MRLLGSVSPDANRLDRYQLARNAPNPKRMPQKTTRLAHPSPEIIQAAAACLRAGGLVAMPTETVYGLAADATSEAAVAGIFAAKDRPTFNPLIAHFLNLEAARKEARFAPEAEKLARAFWPGPLTLVLPAAHACRVSLLARAGLDTVALRVPSHPVARALIEAAGTPLAAPSANRSGRVSPTTAAHVLVDLGGRIDWIIDAGRAEVGVESTIIACVDRGVSLLRPGAIPQEAVERVLGLALAHAADPARQPNSPGQLESHYAPRAELRLDAIDVDLDEAVLDFAKTLAGSPAKAYLDLSPTGDLVEAAANFFAYLRVLDASGAGRIAAAHVPGHGLGAAINDRLRRAAAPRSAPAGAFGKHKAAYLGTRRKR